MVGPIITLLLFGAGTYGAGTFVHSNGVQQKDLTARIGGIPAVPLLTGIGVLAALFSGGWIFPLAAGIAAGSLVAGRDLAETKVGLEARIKAEIQRQIGSPGGTPDAPAPPALPGPGADSPGTEPGNAPGAGVLEWLFKPFRGAPAPAGG